VVALVFQALRRRRTRRAPVSSPVTWCCAAEANATSERCTQPRGWLPASRSLAAAAPIPSSSILTATF